MPSFGAFRVVIDPAVPLVDEQGAPILCMRISDCLYVHPDRWEQFVAVGAEETSS